MSQQNFFQQWFGRKDPVHRGIEEAILLLEEQDYDGALTVLHERALKRDPHNRRALLHVGIAHMLKGDYDKAEELLRPLAGRRDMDSETAAARIALERVAKLRSEAAPDGEGQP